MIGKDGMSDSAPESQWVTCPPKSGPFWELENRLFTA